MPRELSDLLKTEGNLRVFAELAPLFTRFADEFADPVDRTSDIPEGRL